MDDEKVWDVSRSEFDIVVTYGRKVLLGHVVGAKVDVELSSFLITVNEVIRADLFVWRQYITHACNADFPPFDACFSSLSVWFECFFST